MTPTPPPIWGYVTQGHHWFQQHQLEAWGGLAALFVGRAHCEDTQALGAPGPHVAWLGTVGHRARREEGRAVSSPWRRARGHGRRYLDG